MNDAPHLAYSPRGDATPEGEISALSAVYRLLLFEGPDKEKAAGTSGGGIDAAERGLNGRDTRIIPEARH